MNKLRKEKLRKALIKRQIRHDRNRIDEFLAKQSAFNNYFKEQIVKYTNMLAITDDYNSIKLTYNELEEHINNLSAFLQYKGLKKGNFVGIYTENNGRWAICHQAVMRCGAICTLRGSNAPKEELDFITKHCDATGLILKDGKLLNSLKEYLESYNLKFIIVMFKNTKDDFSDIKIPVFSYEEAIVEGKKYQYTEINQNYNEPCAMLYTSGTTGDPKGVLLTHKNLLAQIPSIKICFSSSPGENTLQILPVWHSYEQMAQLYYFTAGCHLHFTTLSGLKNDLKKYNIDSLMSVPRIWEAIRLGIFQKLKQTSHITYRLFDFAVKLSINYKIHKMYSERRITNKKSRYLQIVNLYHKAARIFLKPLHILFTKTLYKKLKDTIGLNFRVSISGGGSLSMKDQLFYDALGVNLREGYGLTETSPVLTLRNINEPNFLGCCGKPIMGTELKIVDIEKGEELGIFQKGIIYARGYQIMKEYYKNEEATKSVIDKDGWFNTGDIGWLTADNNLVIVGRNKETIVLSNGENVEPIPIEDACLESPYIEQIMLVGQDKSSIGALVVPSEAALIKCGVLAKDLKSSSTLEIKDQTLHEFIKKEISTYIRNKQNLKKFEQIKQFEVIKEGFNIANGLLSQTAKLKRNNVLEKYKSIVDKMFLSKE